ncbi:MAG: DUF1365 domain-containing protein [Methyloligellaceae bacterium]
MSTPASAIYVGEVVHKRLRPRWHHLRYSVFSALIDLSELPELDRRLRLFSWNRFNVFSFHDADHGPGRAEGLEAHMRALLAEHGLDIGGGRIRLLCYPRLLGYVFNPLSVYFCHGEDGSLGAIVYEVSNTFHERCSYVVPVRESAGGTIFQACRKQLYVSPFLSHVGRYTFHIEPPGRRTTVGVTVRDGDGPLLKTHFIGRRRPLTDGTLLRALLRYPLMTWKVTGAIHLEALKLWLKGLRTTARPKAARYAVKSVDAGEGRPSHERA